MDACSAHVCRTASYSLLLTGTRIPGRDSAWHSVCCAIRWEASKGMAKVSGGDDAILRQCGENKHILIRTRATLPLSWCARKSFCSETKSRYKMLRRVAGQSYQLQPRNPGREKPKAEYSKTCFWAGNYDPGEMAYPGNHSTASITRVTIKNPKFGRQ